VTPENAQLTGYAVKERKAKKEKKREKERERKKENRAHQPV
jgi:hypothetical protein